MAEVWRKTGVTIPSVWSAWPLSYLSSTTTDYCRIQRWEATKFHRSSVVFWGKSSSLRYVRFPSKFQTKSPPLSSGRPLLLLFISREVFPLSGRIEARRSWGPGSPEGLTACDTAGGCASLGEEAGDWREEAPVQRMCGSRLSVFTSITILRPQQPLLLPPQSGPHYFLSGSS